MARKKSCSINHELLTTNFCSNCGIKIERTISLDDFNDTMTLEEWSVKISKLMSFHDKNSVLTLDAGHNNISFELRIANDV